MNLARRLLLQHLDKRDEEGQRLAGSGLSGGNYIFPGQDMWDRLCLDRRWDSEFGCRQLLLQGRRQGQLCKCCHY